MEIDLETAGLTDIIRLQNQLSEVLHRRFTRSLALSFTDIVGSTAYFARFGDEAGRRLQQRHFDLLEPALTPRGGRIVDTSGDGAFSCYPTVEAGGLALGDFFGRVRDDNAVRSRDDALRVRASLHWGEVLTDGALVSGEAVNLAARVGQAGGEGEARVTLDAFRELPNALKLRCRRMPPLSLKGIADAVETLQLSFHDRRASPVAVRIAETGAVIPLPEQDTISFGRLGDGEDVQGNDIVLAAPDPSASQGISRFHFELRRRADGYALRPVTTGLVEVDGAVVPKDAEVLVRPGTVVRVSRLLTLAFIGPPEDEASLSTIQPY
jgi:class 3 adenylate cyclase